ncbi:MAG: complex I subunit 5 family protein [Bacteroidales bacterium]
MEALLPLFVVIPLGFAFITALLGRYIPLFHRIAIPLVFLFLSVLSVWMMTNLRETVLTYMVGGWEPVNGIPVGIHLSADGFSVLLLVIINSLAFLSAFYSYAYIEQYTSGQYFYALFCLMVAGMNGVAVTGDIFNLYVFLEIAAIASYALVAFGIKKEELEASFKYQVLGGIGSLFILFGIGVLYWATGTLNMTDMHKILGSVPVSPGIVFAGVLLLAGFGIKSAMVPFHSWLPDAHSSAPSPISAMLSGVLIKAIGVYCLLRFFFNILLLSKDVAVILIVLGTISMISGVLLAMVQWDLKRLLAYSSISQIGYVIVSVAAGLLIISKNGELSVASLAIAAGLFHLLNHACFKGLLFLNAGSIEYRLNTRNLLEMGALSGSMPVTSSTSLIASMAISGIPPFNGFFSKLLIIVALLRAGFTGLAIISTLVSFVTIGLFLKFQRYAFYGNKMNQKENITDVPFSMKGSMILLAILCLILSLLIFPFFRNLFLMPAVHALMNMNI